MKRRGDFGLPETKRLTSCGRDPRLFGSAPASAAKVVIMMGRKRSRQAS